MFVYKKDSFLFSSKYLVKILHRDSYSFLSITLSSTDFLYDLSKDLIVCCCFSYCFLCLLCFFYDYLLNYFFTN